MQSQLYLYLEALHSRDKNCLPAKYHGTLVRLYATLCPSKLLRFLKTSDQYPMAEALDECSLRGMIPEKIFLLGQMGNTRAAPELFMTKLVDVEREVLQGSGRP